MKKFYSLFVMALVAASVLLTSCGGDEKDKPNPGNNNAIIKLKGLNEAGFKHGKGEVLKVNIEAYSPDEIAKIRIEKIYEKNTKSGKVRTPKSKIDVIRSQKEFADSADVKDAYYNKPFEYEIKEEDGTPVTITVELKDKGGSKDGRNKRSYATYSFTVGQEGAKIADNSVTLGDVYRSEATIILGDQDATEGSYLSTADAKVYKTAEACGAVSSIDITLASGTKDGSAGTFLLSPRTRASVATFAGGAFNFGSNTCDNGTRETFFTAGVSLDPATATADAIDEIDFTDSVEDFVKITEGGVYSFITQDNKRGVMKIIAIEASGSGKKVTVQYAVQK